MSQVTEQNTAAGRRIESDSFAIIDAEVGEHGLAPDQWAVARRLIHATGDFDFGHITAFSDGAIEAGIAALRAGAPIVVDVGMIAAGLSAKRLEHFGCAVHGHIGDADVIERAQARPEATRAEVAMQKAAETGELDGAIVAVGNAPTALIELERLAREEGIRPALVIGVPVGFVSAVEAKDTLAEAADLEWIVTRGRKGGSPLAVAAVHALMALAIDRAGDGS